MSNSGDDYPGLPHDPALIVGELEMLLTDQTYEPTEDDLALRRRIDETSIQVVAELQSRGIELGLEAGEQLDVAVSMDDYRYLAIKIVHGIIGLEDDTNDYVLQEALARLEANEVISNDERTAYRNSVEAIIGTDQLTATTAALEGSSELEDAREHEAELEKMKVESSELRQNIAETLVSLGLSFDHDDFERFTERLVRAIYIKASGVPNMIMDPVLRRLHFQATRLGLGDKEHDLFMQLGIEDQPE